MFLIGLEHNTVLGHNIAMDRIRIDKWLWAARFYKTRTLASKAVDAGHVKLNQSRCKPSHDARVGDLVEITRGEHCLEARISQLSGVRGPAPVAQTLYEETPESLARRESRRLERATGPAVQAQPGGRPTKRQRRQFEQLRRDLD